MSSHIKQCGATAIILLFTGLMDICAQHNFQIGLLPSVNLNAKLPKDWSLNFEIESRQRAIKGDFSDKISSDYDVLLNDFTLIAGKKIAIDKSLTAGTLVRVTPSGFVFRTIQQYIFTDTYRGLRLAHRLATDQTFASDSDTAYRLRYRISSQFALAGDQVDIREYYLKINHEYLITYEPSETDLEVRIVPAYGLKYSDRLKLEIGLDYRISSFLDGGSEHRFWTMLNMYRSF